MQLKPDIAKGEPRRLAGRILSPDRLRPPRPRTRQEAVGYHHRQPTKTRPPERPRRPIWPIIIQHPSLKINRAASADAPSPPVRTPTYPCRKVRRQLTILGSPTFSSRRRPRTSRPQNSGSATYSRRRSRASDAKGAHGTSRPGSAQQPRIARTGAPAAGKTFSVKTGTVMHRSLLDLRQWKFGLLIWTGGPLPSTSAELARRMGVDKGTAHDFTLRILKAAQEDLPPLREPCRNGLVQTGRQPLFQAS